MEKRKYGFKRGHIETLEPRNLLAADYPALNLAEFQYTTSDSTSGDTFASEATDGIVSNDSRWYTDSSGPHWLQVELKAPYPVGSAHLYLGFNDSNTVSSFSVQYNNGSGWQTAASVTGNTATDVNLLFNEPIDDATLWRFYSTENVVRVKEFVLLPPTADGSAHPLGTGVDLNLASQRAPIASSKSSTNYAVNAVDGFVDDSSRWLSNGSGSTTHTIEANIPSTHEVGSIHLYSGVGTGSVLTDFTIEYANGSGWVPIPGGTVSSGSISGNSVSGNTSDSLIVNFSSPVSANKIRVSFDGGYGRIRELVVLPANVRNDGITGYEIGTSVEYAAPPSNSYTDYDDDWYRIAARSNDNSLITDANGSSQADSNTTDEEKQFQLLYSYASDAFRIRNRDTGKAIEVKDASTDAGAPIVEGNFSAAPHQLWQLEPTSNGYYQIVNVWSGMVLETNNGNPRIVTQQPKDTSADPDDNQEWSPFLQEKYWKKGTGGWVGSFGTGWAYDWARNDPNPSNPEFFYAPMQHREGWPNLGTLHKRYSDWNNDVKQNILLGFNEPDRPDQANMSVNRAVELWPRLEAMDVPVVSPAPALGGEDWWLTPFQDQVDNLGYRTDYAGGHWYAGPSVDNLFAHINDLQNDGNGRDVWLTEFSVVDWSGGSGNWSEETNYNFILEFLWRAENKNNLDKYAIFIFTGNGPTNPWDMSNPRSNFRYNNGSLTPFGKAYAAWDGDKTIRDDTAYILHNRNARHRVRNDGGSGPEASWLRREDDSVQWAMQDAGNGRKYITSLVDGRRLRYNGSTIDYAPSGSTGSSVEWDIQQEQYGWHNIVHSSTGEYLRLVRQNDSNNAPTNQYFEMVSSAAAAGYSSTDWWFVKPQNAAVVPDFSPPEIEEFVFNSDSDQSVDLVFNKSLDTGTIDQSDFVVTHLDTGEVLNQSDWSITLVGRNSVEQVTINMLSTPLTDGNWQIEILGNSFTDQLGNPVGQTTESFSVLAGDANGDLTVDASDYSIWVQNYGSTSNLAADWNRDGVVNAADYTMWRDNLGESIPAIAAASAPVGSIVSTAVAETEPSQPVSLSLVVEESPEVAYQRRIYTGLRNQSAPAALQSLEAAFEEGVNGTEAPLEDEMLLIQDQPILSGSNNREIRNPLGRNEEIEEAIQIALEDSQQGELDDWLQG